MKIKYEFVTGESVEIEIEDNIGEVSIELDNDIYNSDHRETRRHNSVEDMKERGNQLTDGSTDISTIIEQQEMRKDLIRALNKLLPQQRELIHKVFIEGRSMADIAREECVTAKGIQNRINKIKTQLKKEIDKNLR